MFWTALFPLFLLSTKSIPQSWGAGDYLGVILNLFLSLHSDNTWLGKKRLTFSIQISHNNSYYLRWIWVAFSYKNYFEDKLVIERLALAPLDLFIWFLEWRVCRSRWPLCSSPNILTEHIPSDVQSTWGWNPVSRWAEASTLATADKSPLVTQCVPCC